MHRDRNGRAVPNRRGGGFPSMSSVNETPARRPDASRRSPIHHVAAVGGAVEERAHCEWSWQAAAASPADARRTTAELHFFAGMSTVRTVMTLGIRPRGIRAASGSLGTLDPRCSRRLGLVRPRAAGWPAHVRCSRAGSAVRQLVGARRGLSGHQRRRELGERESRQPRWACANSLCGYQIIDDRGTRQAAAPPWVIASREAAWIGVTSPRLAEAPKARGRHGRCAVCFEQFDDVHELQGGEQRPTSSLHGRSRAPAAALEWCRQPRADANRSGIAARSAIRSCRRLQATRAVRTWRW